MMPVESDRARAASRSCLDLAELRLLQLADSALPIGSLAHSFGLETLVSEGLIQAGDLSRFLYGYLEEAGMLEAVFCRQAHRLMNPRPERFSSARWFEINDQLSALKPARESRSGSAALGQNFLRAVLALGEFPELGEALPANRTSGSKGGVIHHSPAFWLGCGALGIDENRAVLAYLHQSIACLVSACQRLLPLGQTEATRILWRLKPAIIETAARSATCEIDDACCFMPLLDWGGMEHPALSTRLFVS
jgi:urease accessory protein